jgi:ribonucleotide monophosphatase NagD (HAD superfamily)
MAETGLTIDCGAFVRALEYATLKDSLLAGKPSPTFYQAAVESMALGKEQDVEIVMVGDDVRTDVGGAQRAGYRGYLVQTGKYRSDAVQASGVLPDRILSSVAELLD